MVYKVENIIFTDNLEDISQEIFSADNKYCLMVCTSGAMQMKVVDNSLTIKANEMVIMATEFFVGQFMRTPDFGGYLLSVDNKMVHELMMEICRVEPRWWDVTKKLQNNPVFRLRGDKNVKLLETYFAMLKLYMEGEQSEYRKKTYLLLAKAATYEVLAGINKRFRSEEVAEAYTAGDKLARNFVNDLKEDDGTHREVAWYATRLNITPKYLSYVCRVKLNMTASGVIQEMTCERIKYFLLKTDMNIKEITYKLKFPSVSFFCKYVRQHFGSSPLEIRKKGRV